MNYFSDGYYFFNTNNQTEDKSPMGFSLLRTRGVLAIELLPGVISSLGNGPAISQARLVLATELFKGNTGNNSEPTIKYVFLPLKHITRIPLSDETKRIIAAAIMLNGKPVLTATPQNSSLKAENLSWRNEEPQKKLPSPVVFDPFHTTNPAYSWEAYPSLQALNQKVSQLNISLPTSLGTNIEKSFNSFGHILVGKYTEELTHRKFFILGVPTSAEELSCEYNEKYNAARFVKATKYYGSAKYAGYHLYYIDEGSTALVKVVVKR